MPTDRTRSPRATALPPRSSADDGHSARDRLRIVTEETDDHAGKPASDEQLLLDFCDRVVVELAREVAVERSRAGVAVRVASGRRREAESNSGEGHTYELSLHASLPPMRSESPLELRGPRAAVRGQGLATARGTSGGEQVLLVSATDSLGASEPRAVVACARDLGPVIEPGSLLVADESWMTVRCAQHLRDLAASLRHVVQGETPLAAEALAFDDAQARLAWKVLTGARSGAEAVRRPAALQPSLDPCALLGADRWGELNAAQQQAVRSALGREVTYIWGPPGTGKTTTLAMVIAAAHKAGLRTLAVAPSNAATDVLALAVADQLADEPCFGRGAMVRFGTSPTAKLRKEFGDRVLPGALVERLVDERYGSLRRELAHLRGGTHATTERSEARNVEAAANDRRSRLRGSIVRDARVVVTPVQQLYLCGGRLEAWGDFDLLIIDEASMATVAQILIAVGLTDPESEPGARVVIAGDFRQLPAPVIARDHEVPTLARDVFHHAGLVAEIDSGRCPGTVVALTDQHRMAPEIAHLVSATFYANRLTTAAGVVRRRGKPWPAGDASADAARAIYFMDSSRVNATASVPHGTDSRVNRTHASLAIGIARSLSSSGHETLILSPFKAQVAVLQHALGSAGEEGQRLPGVRVSTVHRAQGDEADVVILTLDDAPGAPMSRFLRADSLDETGARLLNVALSRARERLIVIAHIDFLQRYGGRVVQRILAEVRRVGVRLEPDVFLEESCSDQLGP